MTPETVHALAEHLSAIDADWRKANGYTGRAVHKRAYWHNMSARRSSDGTGISGARLRIHKPG